jgi:hypothetical protein
MNESFVDPGIWNTVNFYTYSLSENTELALTLYDLGQPARDSLAIALGYKSQLEISPDGDFLKEIKFTHGLMVPLNLRGQGLGISAYAHASARLVDTGTRVTAGLAAGSAQLYGRPTVCGLFALEQPLTEELSVVAEYFTGKDHDLANLITGFVYHNHEHGFVLVTGYKFPNNPDLGRNGLVFEIGGFF